MDRKNPRRTPMANTGSEEIPPGATAKAADRPTNRKRGAPGSGAGTRHAANDEGTPDETYGPSFTNQPIADDLDEAGGPLPGDEEEAHGGPAGGAVGGTPAGKRASGGNVAGGFAPDRGGRGDRTLGSEPDEPAP